MSTATTNPIDKQNDLERNAMPAQVPADAGTGLSPAAYEQTFLSPKTPVAGHLRQTFGNPTAIGELLPIQYKFR